MIWRDPVQASLEKLLEAYNAGCCIGDQEYAHWALLSYAGLALYTGQQLRMVVQNLTTCKICKQSFYKILENSFTPFLSCKTSNSVPTNASSFQYCPVPCRGG